MKREDVRKIFPEATEEQVDAVLNQIGLELNPLKSQLDEANSKRKADLAAQQNDYEGKIASLNERLQAGMSEEERLKAAMDEAEKRAAEFVLKSNTLDAKNVFVSAGLTEEAYTPLLGQVVSSDAETTVANANAIVALLNAQRESVTQATKDALLRDNPTLKGAGGSVGMNKEAFDKLDYAEQVKFLEENPGFLQSIQPKALTI